MDSIDFVNMNLIDMDCIHVVPNNQENYIERLFPKCSPKQDTVNDDDDSSPTKTSASKTNKSRRRRRPRARKPKTKEQESSVLDSNNNGPMSNNIGSYVTNGFNGLGANLPQRPSRLQFNTLSEDDSDPKELRSVRQCQVVVTGGKVKSGTVDDADSSSDDDEKTAVSTCKIIPSISTVSMFPNLDEGLSSDANDSEGDISRQDDFALEADDEDDEQVVRAKKSHKNKQDNGEEFKNPTRSATRSSLNRLAREESAKQAARPSSDTDIETDRLLGSQRNAQRMSNGKRVDSDTLFSLTSNPNSTPNRLKQTSNVNMREVSIEGVIFTVKYLGSTHSDCEGRGDREDRISQAEMAVHDVKLQNGRSSSAVDVQLFISTEKIMVLDRHGKLLMDHPLRTISYIADIGDAIVLIVKTKQNQSNPSQSLNSPDNNQQSSLLPANKSTSSSMSPSYSTRISCHVFESSESHTITKSISQAFQEAYTELLKANGNVSSNGEHNGYPNRELDYQQVLNSQEMSTEELDMFARRENQRDVIIPKQVGEIIGLSIVESGWGSVLPTVVIANIKQDGPADKCKKLSVGFQILSVNGISLVGLPLAECQEILRKTKQQSVARLSIVPGPITVEVKIKRPDTKYQLGFSVQNGVICSLLRGGIAERGGVRVGHRIMSINGTTVVGSPHDKIVNMLANSVGEIRMTTCLTSLYKLILGEEKPVFF